MSVQKLIVDVDVHVKAGPYGSDILISEYVHYELPANFTDEDVSALVGDAAGELATRLRAALSRSPVVRAKAEIIKDSAEELASVLS